MSDTPGVFLGMAKVTIQNEGEPEPRVIECPVYQLTDEEGRPLTATPPEN